MMKAGQQSLTDSRLAEHGYAPHEAEVRATVCGLCLGGVGLN
jgi:hypothetical protein